MPARFRFNIFFSNKVKPFEVIVTAVKMVTRVSCFCWPTSERSVDFVEQCLASVYAELILIKPYHRQDKQRLCLQSLILVAALPLILFNLKRGWGMFSQLSESGDTLNLERISLFWHPKCVSVCNRPGLRRCVFVLWKVTKWNAVSCGTLLKRLVGRDVVRGYLVAPIMWFESCLTVRINDDRFVYTNEHDCSSTLEQNLRWAWLTVLRLCVVFSGFGQRAEGGEGRRLWQRVQGRLGGPRGAGPSWRHPRGSEQGPVRTLLQVPSLLRTLWFCLQRPARRLWGRPPSTLSNVNSQRSGFLFVAVLTQHHKLKTFNSNMWSILGFIKENLLTRNIFYCIYIQTTYEIGTPQPPQPHLLAQIHLQELKATDWSNKVSRRNTQNSKLQCFNLQTSGFVQLWTDTILCVPSDGRTGGFEASSR